MRGFLLRLKEISKSFRLASANLLDSQVLSLSNEIDLDLFRRGTGTGGNGGTVIIALDVVVLVFLLSAASIVFFLEFANQRKQEMREKEGTGMVAIESMNAPNTNISNLESQVPNSAAPSAYSDVIVLSAPNAPTPTLEINTNTVTPDRLQSDGPSRGDTDSIRTPITPGDPILPHDDSQSTLPLPTSPTSPRSVSSRPQSESAFMRSSATSPFLSLDPYSSPLGDPLDSYALPQMSFSRPNSSRINSRTYSRSNFSTNLSRQPSSSSFFSHRGARSIFAGFAGSPTPYDEPALSDTRSAVLAAQLSRQSSMTTLRSGVGSIRRNGSITSMGMPKNVAEEASSGEVERTRDSIRTSTLPEVPLDAPAPSPSVLPEIPQAKYDLDDAPLSAV